METLAADTDGPAPPRLDARPPEPGGIGSARIETLDTRPRARFLPRSGAQATRTPS